jgi:hypothetical protein
MLDSYQPRQPTQSGRFVPESPQRLWPCGRKPTAAAGSAGYGPGSIRLWKRSPVQQFRVLPGGETPPPPQRQAAPTGRACGTRAGRWSRSNSGLSNRGRRRALYCAGDAVIPSVRGRSGQGSPHEERERPGPEGPGRLDRRRASLGPGEARSPRATRSAAVSATRHDETDQADAQ